MRISDWSSDVCSSDLNLTPRLAVFTAQSPFGVGIGVVAIDQEPVERRGQEGQRLPTAEFDTFDLGAVAIDRNFGLVIRDPVATAADGIVGIAVELAVDAEVLDVIIADSRRYNSVGAEILL